MAPHGEHDGLVSNSRRDTSGSDGRDGVGTELTNKGTVRQKRWTTRGRTGYLTCREGFTGARIGMSVGN
ncbi:C6 zinc finger domain [Cordyceps militaris]|uniref:C6 zinc finger domain n=1 Tax=Cordyceps militaris TaxID=73501 RepID=A0A2H4SM18_CORMI|nr:C6 zinc finger domain [Cordyceps militaris]